MATVVFSEFDPDPTLVVDPAGVWRYRGREIRHEQSLRLFKRNLRPPARAAAQPWRTHWSGSQLKVVIEGPALVVRHLLPHVGGWRAVLDSGQEVDVTPAQLRVVRDRLAVCAGGVLAALGGEAVAALMDQLTEDGAGDFCFAGQPVAIANNWSESC